MKVRKEAKIRIRYNQLTHLTQDTTWESNKNTINITNMSQEVSTFPAGDHKATRNRHDSTRHSHKTISQNIWYYPSSLQSFLSLERAYTLWPKRWWIKPEHGEAILSALTIASAFVIVGGLMSTLIVITIGIHLSAVVSNDISQTTGWNLR